MDFNLCQDVYDGLALLAREDNISEELLEKLLNHVCNSLSLKFSSNDHNQSKIIDNAEQKLLTTALAALFLECCRKALGTVREQDMVQSVLQTIGVSDDRIRKITSMYGKEEFHSALRTRLNSAKLDSAPVQNTKCPVFDLTGQAEIRQDYVIKSKRSSWQQITQTEYVIRLPTKQKTDLLFSCSLQNIEDIAIKLRECQTAIERTFTTDQD